MPKKTAETTNKFKKGDSVVYPCHGVGKIINIEKKNISGTITEYYHIQFGGSDLCMQIPVTGGLRLRPVIKEKDIKNCLAFIKEKPKDVQDDWKKRFESNSVKIKDGSFTSIAMVVKELFIRNSIKALSAMERRQYENAFNLLAEEISISGNFSPDEVKNILSSSLDNLLPKLN